MKATANPGVVSELTPAGMELYKLAVEMADRVTARRASTNSFFLTVHSSLAAIVGVIGAVVAQKQEAPDALTFGTLAAVGGVLSVSWWLLLRYYRRLNGAKFEVIIALERSLPVQLYTDEWKILHPDEVADPDAGKWRRFCKWLKQKRHREASLVEQIIPVVFLVIYAILGLRVWCV